VALRARALEPQVRHQPAVGRVGQFQAAAHALHAFSTMARPRPAPVAAVRAASPRKNGVVSWLSFSAPRRGRGRAR
jgi:hypothetical protein